MSSIAEKRKAWVEGVIDTLVGARQLRESPISHRNRLVVILLDSAFETACRAFLKYEKRIRLEECHRHRETLMKVVKDKLPDIDPEVWKNIDFYYEEIRCDLYHQSAAKTLTESSLADYQEVIFFVIDSAFNIKCAELVDAEYKKLGLAGALSAETSGQGQEYIPWAKLPGRTDKVLAAVSRTHPKSVEDVNAFFKKEGASIRLDREEFTTILGRNSGSKKFFYFDRDAKRWNLSKAGEQKLEKVWTGGQNE